MTPDEFWSLTPHEFTLWCQGYRDRREGDRALAAWTAANIMSCWTSEPVQPAALLGIETDPEEALVAEWRRLHGNDDDDDEGEEVTVDAAGDW